MLSNNYNEKCSEIEEKIKSLREAYLNNNKNVSENSLPELILRIGYESNCSRQLYPCDVCGLSQDDSEYVSEGCRMNGDSWGHFYRWCTNCGLTIHSKYDDH
jgi:hypothetical protein